MLLRRQGNRQRQPFSWCFSFPWGWNRPTKSSWYTFIHKISSSSEQLSKIFSSKMQRANFIKVLRKKGAVKIEDAKFNDLYKNLYFRLPSARFSIHTSRRAQISVQRMSLFLIMTHLSELAPLTLSTVFTFAIDISFKKRVIQLGIEQSRNIRTCSREHNLIA